MRVLATRSRSKTRARKPLVSARNSRRYIEPRPTIYILFPLRPDALGLNPVEELALPRFVESGILSVSNTFIRWIKLVAEKLQRQSV